MQSIKKSAFIVALGALALDATACGGKASNPGGSSSPDGGGNISADGSTGSDASGTLDSGAGGAGDATADSTAAAVCFDAAADLAEVPTCFATTCASVIATCSANCACENALGVAITDYFLSNNATAAGEALAAAGTDGTAVLSCITKASVGACAPDGGASDASSATDGAAAACFDAATLPTIPTCLATPCASQIAACESNCACETALSTAISDIPSNIPGAESVLEASGSAGSAIATCFGNNATSCLP